MIKLSIKVCIKCTHLKGFGLQTLFFTLMVGTWGTELQFKYILSAIVSLKSLLEPAVTPTCTVRAPVFGRHQFFGTSEHYGKAHGSLLSGWMNYNYTACCWFPTSSNILILPSQFWQIRFESYWLHCSKCRILVLLRYLGSKLHLTNLGQVCKFYVWTSANNHSHPSVFLITVIINHLHYHYLLHEHHIIIIIIITIII